MRARRTHGAGFASERGLAQGIAPLFVVVGLAVGAASGIVAAKKPPPTVRLADFDHSVHVARDIECAECHTGVNDAARAGVPAVAICRGCHEGESAEQMGPSGATENSRWISAHVESGEELWWGRAYVLPDHVVFSHRRHVGVAKLPCAECHGDVASARTLPGKAVPGTLEMDGCVACHERRGASTDCFACHR